MTRRVLLACLALLALLSLASASPLGRALAEAAAAAPATAAAAPDAAAKDAAPAAAAAPAGPAPQAVGSTVLTGESVSVGEGTLKLKGVSPVVTADTAGYGGMPTSLADIVAATKKEDVVYAVVSAAKGPGDKPAVAVVKASEPSLSPDKKTLTFKNVEFVPAGSAAPIEKGTVEAALKAKGAATVAPPASFKGETVSLTIDNAAPPAAAPKDGDKGLIAAGVGAAVGGIACGPMCAVGGAALGGAVGTGELLQRERKSWTKKRFGRGALVQE